MPRAQQHPVPRREIATSCEIDQRQRQERHDRQQFDRDQQSERPPRSPTPRPGVAPCHSTSSSCQIRHRHQQPGYAVVVRHDAVRQKPGAEDQQHGQGRRDADAATPASSSIFANTTTVNASATPLVSRMKRYVITAAAAIVEADAGQVQRPIDRRFDHRQQRRLMGVVVTVAKDLVDRADERSSRPAETCRARPAIPPFRTANTRGRCRDRSWSAAPRRTARAGTNGALTTRIFADLMRAMKTIVAVASADVCSARHDGPVHPGPLEAADRRRHPRRRHRGASIHGAASRSARSSSRAATATCRSCRATCRRSRAASRLANR